MYACIPWSSTVLEAWGGPGLRRRSVSECRASMLACINNYLETGNLQSCREKLRDLSVPYFHHEFVHLTLGESLSNPVYCRLASKQQQQQQL